jgi:hypothetical protein
LDMIARSNSIWKMDYATWFPGTCIIKTNSCCQKGITTASVWNYQYMCLL